MERPAISRIVIVGGGTAGWMVAAALARVMGTERYDITLIESDAIGTVGVGESTIPVIRLFMRMLGIDENEFARATNATFKLGIEFVDWWAKGERYFHPFGAYGRTMDGVDFLHFWMRTQHQGLEAADMAVFNAETLAARLGRFAPSDMQARLDLPTIAYAYQFDAGLFARYLRRYAETRGVIRREGTIVGAGQDSETGFVQSVQLEDGAQVAGDLFIDCSGFRALLIGGTLSSPFEDWSRWLPCNAALAVPSRMSAMPPPPYTRATAREAGWQWRIPLQHRIGNGHVFCDAFMDVDRARAVLIDGLEGEPLREPVLLRFTAGYRPAAWIGNVVAIGLAGGFLEPLESTAIYLVQVALSKILARFPRDVILDPVRRRFNAEMGAEYRNIRDFLIAHYHCTSRDDTPFWRYCRTMPIPDELRERLEVFRETAAASVQQGELFKESSWSALLLGQGIAPRSYHPVADVPDDGELARRLAQIRASIDQRVAGMPAHGDYIRQHCAAAPSA